MVFVKVLKNSAYFKRFQVRRRRRREGRTDFKARRKMIRQDKFKFNNRKYRLIVRFTSHRVICQIAYATIRGDMTVCQATSSELTNYGVPVGHKNYAAAYCTGLLVARRVLKHFGLDGTFKGKETIDGGDYHVENEDTERRPFKCILDVGLQRTVPGHRMWGALKGAVDGGLHIPHNTKNFPGYKAGDKSGEGEYDAEAHKSKIFGEHLKDYMEMMADEDATKYEMHFSKFIAADIDCEKIEDMYAEAHKKIRADSSAKPAEKKGITHKVNKEEGKVDSSDGTEHVRDRKITLQQRKDKVEAKKTAAYEKMMAECAEEDD